MEAVRSSEILIHVNEAKGIYITEEREFVFQLSCFSIQDSNIADIM
jgi:hypothetical protein